MIYVSDKKKHDFDDIYNIRLSKINQNRFFRNFMNNHYREYYSITLTSLYLSWDIFRWHQQLLSLWLFLVLEIHPSRFVRIDGLPATVV